MSKNNATSRWLECSEHPRYIPYARISASIYRKTLLS